MVSIGTTAAEVITGGLWTPSSSTGASRADVPSSREGALSSPPPAHPVRSALHTKATRHTRPNASGRDGARRPPDTPHPAVARVAAVSPRPETGAVGLAFRLEDEVGPIGIRRVDHADVVIACQRVHSGRGPFGHGHVWGAMTGSEPDGRVRAMDVPQRMPLVVAVVALGLGLAPDLERET